MRSKLVGKAVREKDVGKGTTWHRRAQSRKLLYLSAVFAGKLPNFSTPYCSTSPAAFLQQTILVGYNSLLAMRGGNADLHRCSNKPKNEYGEKVLLTHLRYDA